MKRKAKRPKCDCHLHERQVCDICQKVKPNAKDKRSRGGK